MLGDGPIGQTSYDAISKGIPLADVAVWSPNFEFDFVPGSRDLDHLFSAATGPAQVAGAQVQQADFGPTTGQRRLGWPSNPLGLVQNDRSSNALSYADAVKLIP